MPKHSRFEQMCALALLGQLSREEQRELDGHLSSCLDCRQAVREFETLTSELPAVVSEKMVTEHPVEDASGFLARCNTQGIYFSREVQSRWKRSSEAVAITKHNLLAGSVGLIAAGAVAAIAAIVCWPGALNYFTIPAGPVPPRVATSLSRMGESRRTTASGSNSESSPTRLEQELEQLRANRERVQEKLNATEDQLNQQSAKVEQLEGQLSSSSRSHDEAARELAEARTERDGLAASVVANQQIIQDLNQKLKDERTITEQDRELASAAKEVRQLMGARNLHIIDVFDVESNGESRKSFGRVFYTEQKSLIFYAFDLPKEKRGKQVVFQAWGQKLHQQGATSLGVFLEDDQVQNRWILHVNDPKLLAKSDMVFVTIEKSGKSDHPTGQTLLYAYLKNPVNHP